MKKEMTFKNVFEDVLFGNSWEVANAVANVVIITGMAEHSSRYDDFAKFLNKNKFSVYCIDHYGQGKNGELGHGGDNFFFKMQKTVDELILKLKNETKLPTYIFSHSMGSFVCQGYIENYKNADKVVICGSNYMGALGGIGYTLAKIVVNKKNHEKPAGILNSLAIGAYEKAAKGLDSKNGWLSFNEENYHAYDQDPLSGYHCTNGFYLEFMKGLASLNKKDKLKQINPNLPIFVICGDNDPVGNNGKGPTQLHKLYRKYNLNAELKVYQHMKHEILNEREHATVYNDILEFYLR